MEMNEEVGYVTEPVVATTEDKFGKEALLKYFEDDATLLNILLEDDQSYSSRSKKYFRRLEKGCG